MLLVSRGSLVLKVLAMPLIKQLDFVSCEIDPMLRRRSEHFQKPTTAVECVGLKDFVWLFVFTTLSHSMVKRLKCWMPCLCGAAGINP